MGCGIELEANQLLTALLEGKEFTLPEVDFNDPKFQFPEGSGLNQVVKKLTNEDLTTRQKDGSGTFDALMSSFAAHLQGEYDANRITGAEYTKAYSALSAAAMGNAVTFLLGRDQAYWQALAAQVGALTALTQLETAKMQYAVARYEAMNMEATYALTKEKLATESVNYCIGQFNLENILPQQLITAEKQAEAANAQTSDVKLDGTTPVTGTLGKQRELYDQQITSYQRDSELKAAKLWTDAWTVQKTVDEGLEPPDEFTNANVNEVLETIKTNNNLG